MNKQEFAASLSEKMNIPQSEALRFIRALTRGRRRTGSIGYFI